MSTSQNCAFTAPVEKDPEFEHPPGAALARAVGRDLKELGWTTSDIDNWRDCGWSVTCERDGRKLDVILAALPGDKRWMFQVAPWSIAGFAARLFGRVSSATESDVLSLAKNVDFLLRKPGRARDLLWRWDGFPKPGAGTDHPE